MTRPVLAGVLTLATLALLYTLSRIDEVAIQTETPDDGLPRYTLANAVLTRYDANGDPALRATAATLEYFDDESARANTLTLDVLTGTETPWRITSPTGRIPADSRALLLEGGVVARGNWPDNGEALTLRTESLWVDPDRNELRTEALVDAESQTRIGSGVGLNANWAQRDLYLLNNVKMRYEANP